MSAVAKIQAHVDRLRGFVASDKPKRKTEEVGETRVRSIKGTWMGSSLNWHCPVGTSDLMGAPCKEEGSDVLDMVRMERLLSVVRLLYCF